MIASLGLILLCQLAGEALVRGIGLTLPGPVVGLLLLLTLLLARDKLSLLEVGPLRNDGIEKAAKVLLANMSLMFVPAGVGVVQKLDLIAEHGLAIAGVLVGSVIITLVVTMATFLIAARLMARWRSSR
ncbi:MAG TPA: CidA/LrgA family protein [Rhodopseudomonas sp.]|uniref:CidA/LrgA family protein n=1 Tax=Rhodopseudomonas sp. TaxID=1078 RepID=UPI002EDAC2FF